MRKLFEITIAAILISILSVTSIAMAVDNVVLINAYHSIFTGAGVRFDTNSATRMVQLDLTGESNVSATAVVQGSLNNSTWSTVSTVPLTTAAPTQFLTVTTPYPYMRANITAISGTYGAGGFASAVAADTYARVTVLVAQ